MIQKHTLLDIIDNSGANQVRCVHVYTKGKNKNPISVGGTVKAAVQRLKKSIPKKKVKKSEVVNVLVVSVRANLVRPSGSSLKNVNNLGVVLNKDLDSILSNRIVSPMSVELRRTRFSKLLTLAPRIL